MTLRCRNRSLRSNFGRSWAKPFLSEPAKQSELLADCDSRALADRITSWAASLDVFGESCQGTISRSLPLFPLRQYDEPHALFRDNLPVLFGSHHLRAQEAAGDCTPGREVYERVQACLERVQSADRAGDL